MQILVTIIINNHISKQLRNGDSKPLFKLISLSRKGATGTHVAGLNNCGNDTEIANSFASNFQSVFTVDNGSNPTIAESNSGLQRYFNINKQGVLDQLKSLDHRKGAGPDDIRPSLLKFLAPFIATSLTTIFNRSLSTSCVPEDWKQAIAIPVYKKGDRRDPLNYRPISLTCITSKIFEHIISHEMRNHLDNYNILSDVQHGFRKLHSCESPLIHTISELCFHNNNSDQVDVIVLDFSKAFDTVSHAKLINKLKAYNFFKNIILWIEDWLRDRSFLVSVNGSTSRVTAAYSGVPQGSVLGPLLFLVYINDLPMTISCHKTSIRLFADDALLYRPIKSLSDSHKLQQQLNAVINWPTYGN